MSVATVTRRKDNLSKVGWSLGGVSTEDLRGRTIWIADAHRDRKRYVVHAEEKLTAFLELESTVRPVKTHAKILS